MTIYELAKIGARLRRKELAQELTDIRNVLRGKRDDLVAEVRKTAKKRKLSPKALKALRKTAAYARKVRAQKLHGKRMSAAGRANIAAGIRRAREAKLKVGESRIEQIANAPTTEALAEIPITQD